MKDIYCIGTVVMWCVQALSILEQWNKMIVYTLCSNYVSRLSINN